MHLDRRSLLLVAILVTGLVVFSARRALFPESITAQPTKPIVTLPLAQILKVPEVRTVAPLAVDPPAALVADAPGPKGDAQQLEEISAPLMAFQKWAEVYAVASPETRVNLTAEGSILATARGAAMAQLIRQDPQAAIQALLPYSLRKSLPPEIAARIEHRVSGVGDLMVVAVTPLPGRVVSEPIYRTASLGNEKYRAYVYGSRTEDVSRKETRILGVGIKPLTGNPLVAVREDAYEVLDPAEAADLDPDREQNRWPATESSTPSHGTEIAIDTGKELFRLCCSGHIAQWLDSPEGKIVAAAGGSGSSDTISPVMPATYTQGHKKLLVMRVRFADQAVGYEPATDVQLQIELQKVVDALPKWSYGKMTAEFVFSPTFDLPGTEASYASGGLQLLDATRLFAAGYTDASGNRPYNTANFDFDAVVFQANWGEYGGLGYVGANGTMIKWVGAGIFLHEWGHNFGLPHANFFEPTTDSPIATGIHYEYGNYYSSMGISDGFGSFTAGERFRISWLQEKDSPEVATSGNYRIYNSDTSSLISGRNYALRVKKAGYTYNVEYRPNWSIFSTSFNTDHGVMIQRQERGQLIDMNPLSAAGRDDVSLLVGRSFHDPERSITVTTVGSGGIAPNNYLDVVINLDDSLTNSPPVAKIAASNLAPTVNAPITLTAYAADPDGDTLAYSWNFGDASNPSVNNSATQTKIWSTAGEYPVRCTVSDRRGKSFVQTLMIRVGVPSSFTISGRVTQVDGIPIQNVLVKAATSRLTYTDADGRYSFGALPIGSYVMSAVCNGRVVTAQTQSPVVVGPSASGVDFTMSARSGVSTVGITLERWSGITGSTLASLRSHPSFLTTPTSTTVLTRQFDAARNQGDNYGQRASGYFLPPVSGVYTFYLSSDDHSELSLSTTDQAANKRVIASILGFSNLDQWNKYPSQKSAAITLVAGQRYYIEALHKEGTGGDHFAVGVDFPDGRQQRPVEATYFQPVSSSIISPPNTVTVTATDPLAREGLANNGTFTVTRTGSTTNALTVCFNLTGTADYPVDYQPTGLSVVIPASASSATVVVEPIDDTAPEPDETIVLQLAPAVTYAIGPVPQATVTVQDNEIPTISIVATRPAISENGDELGVFTFTRNTNLSDTISVNIAISGTATNGSDYPSLASVVTIPVGEYSTVVTLPATADNVTEPEETITIGLSPGTGYTLENSTMATCYILAQPPVINWKLASSGSWSERTRWLTDCPIPSGSALYAFNFNVTGPSYSSQNDLGANYRINQLNFSGTSVTLTGESLALVESRNGAPTLNQNSGNEVSILNQINLTTAVTLGGNGNGNISLKGIISGSGGINKTHSGRLSLAGMNNYTGGTTISRGSIEISEPQQSGLGTGKITLENGTTLNLNRNIMPNELVMKAATLSATNGYGDQWQGPITFAAGVSTIDLASTGNFVITGNIEGAGGLRKLGTSSRALTLSGIATYTGPTTVAAGSLTCTRPEALAQGTLRIDSGAKLKLDFNATRQVRALQLSSTTLQADGIYGSVASGATFQNDIYFSGLGTITVGPLPATPFETWAAAQGLTGVANITPMADPDGDGICNMLEFMLGSSATQSSATAVPKLKVSGTGGTLFEFDRSDASISSITAIVEYGSDLTGWSTILIPVSSSGQVSIVDGPVMDRVSVTIPIRGSRVFARLRVTQ